MLIWIDWILLPITIPAMSYYNSFLACHPHVRVSLPPTFSVARHLLELPSKGWENRGLYHQPSFLANLGSFLWLGISVPNLLGWLSS